MKGIDARPTHSDGHDRTPAIAPCKCGCGAELVIVCPKGCEDAELYARADMDPIARLKAPTRPDAPPRKTRARTTEPRIVPAWICGRCGLEIPKKGGRAPKYHYECCTPAEKATIDYRNVWNQKQREKAIT